MTSVRIGDRDYILRADLNALGEIAEEFGGFDAVSGIKGTLAVAAVLINEHFAFIGEKERVTPGQIGSITDIDDLKVLQAAVTKAVKEGLGNPKNA